MGVSLGIAGVDVASFVNAAGIEQDALRQRRLASVDVGHDSNISQGAGHFQGLAEVS
jgi:hypothetical protein